MRGMAAADTDIDTDPTAIECLNTTIISGNCSNSLSNEGSLMESAAGFFKSLTGGDTTTTVEERPVTPPPPPPVVENESPPDTPISRFRKDPTPEFPDDENDDQDEEMSEAEHDGNDSGGSDDEDASNDGQGPQETPQPTMAALSKSWAVDSAHVPTFTGGRIAGCRNRAESPSQPEQATSKGANGAYTRTPTTNSHRSTTY